MTNKNSETVKTTTKPKRDMVELGKKLKQERWERMYGKQQNTPGRSDYRCAR